VSRRPALLVAVLLAVLAAPASASASEQHPTLPELEKEVMCPTCHTPLELSHAPAADRIRAFIRTQIAAGKTKSQIKDELVDMFGESILAAPPAKGFNLLAWLLPLIGGLVALVVLAALARHWRDSRASDPADRDGPPGANGRTAALDPELERRLDNELARFDA
jgi:cytochrome c-type biogenesis protein CcmH